MSARRLAIVGHGRMGRAVEELATARGFRVVAVLEGAGTAGSGFTVDDLQGADVAIEFTEPEAAVGNIHSAVAARCPIVVGTTGWYSDLPAVERIVREAAGALFWAPNFSVGVAAFMEAARTVALALAAAGSFSPHLIETHHSAKKDAPSGTALALAREVSSAFGEDIPISSVRVGSVPGTHELLFDAPFEQLRITHEARDRRVFAEGALVAAGWLIGRQGTYTMRDLVRSARAAGAP
ncbi:MAG: 4-hydroxy-tetrahydrodipicolinate reductase [Gemmatimonadaceae bacterium]